jgi:mannose-6-phosphate isomerase-like protein (cupin superfamily)
MTLSIELLQVLAHSIVRAFRHLTKAEFDELLSWQDYHGFGKSRLTEAFQSHILKQYGLASNEVQVEIVRVATDLTREVHYHQKAFAYIVGLGKSEHLVDSRGARAFLSTEWVPFTQGQEVAIPAGTHHGFTVEDGGELYFLSVQAPPIVSGQEDDYNRVC